MRNRLLPDRLAEVSVVFAQPFTDPELGPSYHLRWTRHGDREAAIVTEAELDEVSRLVSVSVQPAPVRSDGGQDD